jgi:CubicO group peptidase (beta-lactamase class C family)
MNRRQFVQSALAAPASLSLSTPLFLLGPLGHAIAELPQGPIIRPPSSAFLDTLPHLMELAQLPGLGMGVVQGAKLVWQHYAGLANAQTKAPITADSIFPAASMGKQLCAYAALELVQDGKLDLDRPLKEYLQDGAPTGKWSERITARHVLSHSSGLPNWRWQKDQPLTPAFEPGTKFRYSGEGFYYLQRCMEHITGVGAEQFLQDRVMKPFGMTSSTYLWRADAESRIVAGHHGDEASYSGDFAKKLFAVIQASGKPLASWRHEEIVEAMLEDKSSPLLPNSISPNAAFSLLTKVSDYSRFLTRIVSPRGDSLDLSSSLRTEMIKPLSHINSALAWGLGWGIEQDGAQPPYLWQWGDNGGWKNFVLVHPESRSAIVVFTNGSNGMHVIERILLSATGHEHSAFLWV